MNNEYRWLSDSLVEVLDENRNVEKRECKNNNIQEILLSENKVEIIDNRLEKLNNDLFENEKVIFLSKKMLKIQPYMILIITLTTTLLGFIRGGFSHMDDFMNYGICNGIYHGVQGLFGTIIAVGVTSIYFGIVKMIYQKDNKKLQTEIAISKDLKKQYEKELSIAREKKVSLTDLVTKIDESVSLVEQNNTIESYINEELDKAYEGSLKNKSKRLVLRKKN